MALVLKDRVLETCTSPGTGTVTLLGAVTGYQSFSTVGNGNTCYYAIADQNGANFEVGIGTYSTAGTLARTTVLSSSNSNNLVNFSTGSQNIFLTYPSSRSVNLSSAALTSGRVTFATTDGLLTDSAALTFDGTNLSVTSPSTATTFTVADNGGRLVVLKNALGAGGNAEVGTTTNHDFYVRAGAGAAGLNSLYLQAGGVTGYSLSYVGLHAWFNGATQAMTLNTSGNLGIGTTSPADTNNFGRALDIRSSTGAAAYFRDSDDATKYNVAGFFGADSNGYFGTWGTGTGLLFFSSGVQRMQIDSSGNLGLGVTPSAWGWTAFQLGTVGSSLATHPTLPYTFVGSNWYQTGSIDKYVTTNTAGVLSMNGNVFSFLQAPSGSANATISFTQAMTLDASSRLSINTTAVASGCNLNVLGGINSTNGAINVSGNGGFYNGANKFGLDNASGASRLYSSGPNSSTRGSYDFHITDSVGTLDTIAMTLDASGNLGIGTTSPSSYVTGLTVAKSTASGADVALVKIDTGTANENGQAFKFFNYGPAGFGRTSGVVIGSINWFASQPSSGAAQDASAIQCLSESQNGTSTASQLTFSTVSGSALVKAMTIDSAQNVLIGTTGTILSQGKVGISFNGATNQALNMRTSLASSGSTFVQFENSTGALQGFISAASTTTTSYNTASTSGTGAQLNVSGVTFPATQVASADVNTLDDYEEGTWTPSLTGFTSIAYSTQTGAYTKIGNVVHIVLHIVVSGGTRSGAEVLVENLPFTAASQAYSGGSWGYGYGVVASSVGMPQLRVNNSSTNISLLKTDGTLIYGTDLNTATPTIAFSATYRV